jgi:hypothetical protein
MPTRIFEFLSQGKPVIAARTLGVLDYFAPAELVLFEAGDAGDLAAKIKYVFEHPQGRLRPSGVVRRSTRCINGLMSEHVF